MTVAIVTDSAAAVPARLAAECGITVVPMWLVSDGEAVREGERTLGELLGDARITTSAPTPGEFEDAIRSALERGASDVLVLTIASAMSASHDAAAVAVRDVGRHARVVDTMTAAGAQALVVLAAARAANTGLSLDDVAVIEINEAFATVVLQTVRDLHLEDRLDDVNPNGGGISLGHPLGATGARITATLLNELDRRGARYGIASMCVGFGMAIAGVVERV